MRTVAFGVLLVLAAGCGSEPVAVPDLTGLSLDEARDVADTAGLDLEEVDASGDGRAVFSSGNWAVEAQRPEAGATVEPGGTVTVDIANVRDAVSEPEPASAPDPPPEEPDPEPAPRDTELPADVRANPTGLTITSDIAVHGCSVDVNAGLIRSGYTTTLAMLTAGEPYTVPWGDLTDRDGDRFDYSRTAPEMVTVSCTDEDGAHRYDTWAW